MTKHKHCTSYICEACTAVFQVFGLSKRGHVFCPNCGESADVHKHEGIYRAKESITNLKTKWTKPELDILQQVLSGKLRPYQAAIMTGRSNDSVLKKVKRLKEGTNNHAGTGQKSRV